RPIKIAIIAITTNNSISVNAPRRVMGRLRRRGRRIKLDTCPSDKMLQAARSTANGIRELLGWAKQFFAAAVKLDLLTRNPFVGPAANTQPDRTRDYFVTRDEAAKIIRSCPDAEWRLIVTLCRFAGLRCPIEVRALRWGDVLWDQER